MATTVSEEPAVSITILPTMCMSLKRSSPLKVVDQYSVHTSHIFSKCKNDINSIVFSTETDFLSPSDVLAISSQIKELVSNVGVLRGKTRELVSRDWSFHSFRPAITEEEKTTPEAVGWWHNSISPSYQDGFCLTSLLQSARKVRLWYFTLLPNYVTGGKGSEARENEEKWKTEDVVDNLAGESVLISHCQFSRLHSSWHVRFWRQQTKLLAPVIITNKGHMGDESWEIQQTYPLSWHILSRGKTLQIIYEISFNISP